MRTCRCTRRDISGAKVDPGHYIGEQTGLSGFGELVVSMAMTTDADACDVEPAAKRHRPDLTDDEAGQLLRDAVPRKPGSQQSSGPVLRKGFQAKKALTLT